MRFMVTDPVMGFIVKDPDKGEQCAYKARGAALLALVEGIARPKQDRIHNLQCGKEEV